MGAYRFWSEIWGDDGFPIAPVADEASRWDSDAWGPGETLRWEVSRDEDWAVLFESEDGVLPWIDRALDSWSEIPTADISWTLDGVGEAEPRMSEDSVNTLFIDSDAGFGGFAGIWEEREEGEGPWRVFGCDIALGGRFAWKPDSFDDWDPDEQSDWLDRGRDAALYVLVHEFGHCAGLAHSARLSTGLWDLSGSPRETHAGDPAMSYGRALPHADDLSRDDIVGASLLRPASGYRRRSGNIAGTVTMPGLPVDFAVVWALPLGEHPLRDRVGVFTNRTGEFEIEGLDPGEYLIITQPIIDFSSPHEFLGPLRVSDVIRGGLVRVSAGRTVRRTDVSMRWGREVRAPYAEVGSGKGQEGSTPITGSWGRICSGIRVRAERPTADGGYDGFAGEWSVTTLTIEYPASADLYFDWVGPYRDWEYVPESEENEEGELEVTGWRFFQWPLLTPYLDIGHQDWQIERFGSTIRQEMQIAWPPDAEPTLRIRSHDDTCTSEPLVICDFAGCELRESAGTAGGEGAVTFSAGNRIPDFPTGVPNVLSNAGFTLVGGVVTITLQRDGYVEYPGHRYRYTCGASDCGIRAGLVTAGQITRTVAGSGGTPNRVPDA